jgi:hypothetical protein
VRIYLNLRSGPTWPAEARLFNLFHPTKQTAAPPTFASQGLMLSYYNIYNLFISILYLQIQIGRCGRCVGGYALANAHTWRRSYQDHDMQVYNWCAHFNLRACKVGTAKFTNSKSHIYFVTFVDSHSRAWLTSVLPAKFVYSFSQKAKIQIYSLNNYHLINWRLSLSSFDGNDRRSWHGSMRLLPPASSTPPLS